MSETLLSGCGQDGGRTHYVVPLTLTGVPRCFTAVGDCNKLIITKKMFNQNLTTMINNAFVEMSGIEPESKLLINKVFIHAVKTSHPHIFKEHSV